MTGLRPSARTAVGTIVAKNFLPFARVLACSIREHHPELPVFVALADQPQDPIERGREPFELVPLEALGIPDLRNVCFRYTRQQLSVAAKPFLLGHLLDRGFTSALFLDADILVCDRIDPLIDAVAAHAIALTPHLLDPLAAGDGTSRELNILQSGVYNGGFIGVSARPAARAFLAWFADRLHTQCRHDVARGMHFDQRWLDLVPTQFDEVGIVRDAGCNVAHWNLPERDLRMDAGRASTRGGPCRFFHFSGFEPAKPGIVTRYSERLTMESIGPAAELFARYTRLLEQHGSREDPPYAYGRFDNGVPIPDIARRLYLERDDVVAEFGDPFATAGERSFFRWLNQPAAPGPSGESRVITRLWDAVYRSRADVRAAYPNVDGADREGFLRWTAVSGLAEHGIADVFLV